MQTVTIEEAKTHLLALIESAIAGKDLVITKNDNLSVKLVPCVVKKRKRHFGSAKGLISMSSDFDEPLAEFENYTYC